MRKANQMGASTPDSILQPLWFYNTVHFDLRGCAELRDMCLDDLTLKTDENGQKYPEFTEKQKRQMKMAKSICSMNESVEKVFKELHLAYSAAVQSNHCYTLFSLIVFVSSLICYNVLLVVQYTFVTSKVCYS